MSKEGIAKVLSKYVPAATVELCSSWIVEKNIHLRITRGRATKYGDYKPLEPGRGHHISVNHDLNPFSFLITFTHEVAHLHTFIKYKHRHDPHGKEWKYEFSILLKELIALKSFPEDIESALLNYAKNPAASGCNDHLLHRTLKKYDKNGDKPIVHLEDLETGTEFSIHQSPSGMIFRKGEKRRTRYHCVEVKTNREYLVSGIAEVVVRIKKTESTINIEV